MLLFKHDLSINRHIIITTIAAIASVLFLYTLVVSNGFSHNFHPMVYLWVLFVGGFWISSLAFKDLHDKQKSYLLLTLPCSNLEKFLVKLILTSVGYVLASLVLYYLLSVIVVVISALLLHKELPLFTPFRNDILVYIRNYFVFQSVFLLGSIYFKRHAMTKTVLSLGCLAIVFTFFTFLTIVLLLGPLGMSVMHVFSAVIGSLLWIVLAPCCWLIAYIRLCEVEV